MLVINSIYLIKLKIFNLLSFASRIFFVQKKIHHSILFEFVYSFGFDIKKENIKTYRKSGSEV